MYRCFRNGREQGNLRFSVSSTLTSAFTKLPFTWPVVAVGPLKAGGPASALSYNSTPFSSPVYSSALNIDSADLFETLWPIYHTKLRRISENLRNFYESSLFPHKKKDNIVSHWLQETFLWLLSLEKISGFLRPLILETTLSIHLITYSKITVILLVHSSQCPSSDIALLENKENFVCNYEPPVGHCKSICKYIKFMCFAWDVTENLL